MNEICVPLESALCVTCGAKFKRIPQADLPEDVTAREVCAGCDMMARPPLVDDTPEPFAVLRLTPKEVADGLYRFNRMEHEGTTLYLVRLEPAALACRFHVRNFHAEMRYRAVVLEVSPGSVRTTYEGSGETPALALEEATKRAYLFRP